MIGEQAEREGMVENHAAPSSQVKGLGLHPQVGGNGLSRLTSSSGLRVRISDTLRRRGEREIREIRNGREATADR